MIQHLQIIPLILGLIVGIIAILCINPEKSVVHVYPQPTTAEKTIYKDNNGVCYRYKPREVNCDANEAKLKEFPLSK